jgi:hypothetical protein
MYRLVQQMEDGFATPLSIDGLRIVCSDINHPDTIEWLQQVQEKNIGITIFWELIT